MGGAKTLIIGHLYKKLANISIELRANSKYNYDTM